MAVSEAIVDSLPLEENILLIQIVLSSLLGLFLGLEREWSNKSAGVRTFALITILGTVFGISKEPIIISSGIFFVTTLAFLLGIKGLLIDGLEKLSLTTSVSLLLAYGIGILVSYELYLESVGVALISTLLLVLKRDLHNFTSTLTKDELKSAAELAIISIVIFPLLPSGEFGPWDSIDPQLIWILVIAVSSIGFLNYIALKKFQSRGVWFTSFVGGLVNSTAVIISVTDRVGQFEGSQNLAFSSILLANAAMTLRNLVIALVFLRQSAFNLILPFGSIILFSIIGAYYSSQGGLPTDIDINNIKSPFSKRNAFFFGGLFICILVISAASINIIGESSIFATLFAGGLVSSGTSTTTAIALFESGQISQSTVFIGVFVGTIASMLVKVFLAVLNARSIVKNVLIWNLGLILISLILSALLYLV